MIIVYLMVGAIITLIGVNTGILIGESIEKNKIKRTIAKEQSEIIVEILNQLLEEEEE